MDHQGVSNPVICLRLASMLAAQTRLCKATVLSDLHGNLSYSLVCSNTWSLSSMIKPCGIVWQIILVTDLFIVFYVIVFIM